MEDGQENIDDQPLFARSGITSKEGKCTGRIPVYLPESIKAEAEMEAAKLGTCAGEIGRDLYFMWLKGMTYGEYVANDRRAALMGQGTEKGFERFTQLRVVGEVGK